MQIKCNDHWNNDSYYFILKVNNKDPGEMMVVTEKVFLSKYLTPTPQDTYLSPKKPFTTTKLSTQT
jgi:hypothetical protein